MSQTPPPPDDTPPPSQPAPEAVPPAKKRHWGRRILIAAAVIILILIIVVLLAPTLLSTGPVRRLIVSQINNRLNGKVTIADWSLGWGGPLKISGVHVYDAAGTEILSLDDASTQLGLWRAVTGTFDLGKTTIDGLNLTDCQIDRDGKTNYQQLLKAAPIAATPAPPSKPHQPSSLPQVRGSIAITHLRGRITVAGAPQALHIDPSRITINITDINQPITNSIELAYHIGNSPAGKITLDGSVAAVVNGRIDAQKLSADETLKITDARLDALAPLLRIFKVDLSTAGIADGQLKLTAAGLDHLSAEGQIQVADLKLSGPLLKGDAFSTKVLTLPIHVSVASADSNTALLDIKTLGVNFDQGKLAITGSAPVGTLASVGQLLAAAMDHAITGHAPAAVHWQGGQGQLAVTADIPDIASIANQLPHLLKLRKDLTLSAGKLHHQTTLALSPEDATLSTTTDIDGVAGLANGKPVTLPALHLSAQATAQPAPAPTLRDLKLAVTSGFASINGNGAALTQMQLDGQFDLEQLKSQVGQFINLQELLKSDQPLQLAGKGTFQLATLLGGADMKDVSAKGQIQIADLRLGGGLLDGDTYSTGTLLIPVDVTVDWAGTPAALLDIRALGLQVDQGKIALSGRAPLAALSSLGELIPAAIGQHGTVQWHGGSGQLTLIADVPDLSALANQLPHLLQLRPGMKLSAGMLHHQTVLTLEADKAVIATASELTHVAGEDNGRPISLQPIQLSANVTATPTPSPSLRDIKLTMSSGFASMSGGGASLSSLKFDGQLDLHHVQTQLDQFINLATLLKAPGPINMEGQGTFAVTTQGDAAQADASVQAHSQLTLTDVKITGLSATGAPLVQPRLAMAMDATVNRSSAGIQGLHDVHITLVSGPSNQPVVSLEAQADVTLAPALAIGQAKLVRCDIPNLPQAQKQFAAFLPPDFAVLAGSLSAGAQASYVNGQFRLTQPLSVNLTHLTLDQVEKGQHRRLLSDQPVALTILADQPDPNSIHLAELKAKLGDALAASATGTIFDLSTQRRLQDVRIDLDYDLAKLWPIVRPVALTPQQQQQYAQMAMEGKFQKVFTLSGSYPANMPFNQAISHLQANGAVALSRFIIPEKGIEVANADVPFTLDKGIVTTGAPPARAATTQPAASALLNGGRVRLDRLHIDLTSAHPTLTTPDNYLLLQDVALNSVFAKSVMSQFINNPLFADAKQADGQMSATILQCRDLPLDGSLMEPTATGSLSLRYSITNLQIGNQLITSLVQYLSPKAFNRNSLQGAIKDGTVELSHGIVTHHTPISVDQYVIGLDGSVAMATARFTTPMNMMIPTALFRQKELTAALSQLTIPLTGTATEPKIDLGKAIQDNIGKGLLNQLFKQPQPSEPQQNRGTNQPPQQQQQQQQNNPLDQLLKDLGGKKKKHQ